MTHSIPSSISLSVVAQRLEDSTTHFGRVTKLLMSLLPWPCPSIARPLALSKHDWAMVARQVPQAIGRYVKVMVEDSSLALAEVMVYPPS